MANVNTDLDGLHAALVRLHDRLHVLLGQQTDPSIAQAILTEMQEITHRIDIVQSVLFAQRTAQITAASKDVQTATASLNASLGGIKTATQIVQDCTTFLAIVDRALDLAKLAMM